MAPWATACGCVRSSPTIGRTVPTLRSAARVVGSGRPSASTRPVAVSRPRRPRRRTNLVLDVLETEVGECLVHERCHLSLLRVPYCDTDASAGADRRVHVPRRTIVAPAATAARDRRSSPSRPRRDRARRRASRPARSTRAAARLAGGATVISPSTRRPGRRQGLRRAAAPARRHSHPARLAGSPPPRRDRRRRSAARPGAGDRLPLDDGGPRSASSRRCRRDEPTLLRWTAPRKCHVGPRMASSLVAFVDQLAGVVLAEVDEAASKRGTPTSAGAQALRHRHDPAPRRDRHRPRRCAIRESPGARGEPGRRWPRRGPRSCSRGEPASSSRSLRAWRGPTRA